MNDAKPISIAPYLDVIYRHRLIAICVLALGLGTTLCLMLMLPNVYQSTAVIVIEPPQVSPDYVDVGNVSGPRQHVDVADQLEALAHQAFSQTATGRTDSKIWTLQCASRPVARQYSPVHGPPHRSGRSAGRHTL